MFTTPDSSNAACSSVALDAPDITASELSEMCHPSATCMIKRLLDVVGSLVGLVITFPIAIVVVIANKIDSPGPLFYTQKRCGLNGQPFKIWKLRSMVVGADKLQHTVSNQAKGLVFKHRSDPRVTRVGKFLRRTSLDELPQCA